jgi:DNA-binding transcriptional ArsR family regulator
MSQASPDTSANDLPEPRELTDPKVMRALTHPVRLALLEVLATEGPLTATEAGELIGESPTTCSFHFRQLKKYGFIEEAGTGPGRQRHWKFAHGGMRFSDTSDDPEANIAATSLSRLVTDRAIARMQNYEDTKANYSKDWQRAAESTESVLFVTADELSELNADIRALLDRHRERMTNVDARPADSRLVEVLLFTYPARFTGAAK